LANPLAHYVTTGPELWRQLGSRLTHYAASTGTCGTITGTARFLKEQNPNIEIVAVAPIQGHDIPGVRSISQLAQTEHFHPEEYDHIPEVNNEDSYALCYILNQQAGIQAGPSTGLALAGLVRTIREADARGEKIVAAVIGPDNVFKYTANVKKHLPHAFPANPDAPPSLEPMELSALDFARKLVDRDADVTVNAEGARDFVNSTESRLIDVRGKDDFPERLQGAKKDGTVAVNLPLKVLLEKKDATFEYLSKLPQLRGTTRDTPLLLVCNRGVDSSYSALILKAAGYRNVKHLMGGMFAWKEANFPENKASPQKLPKPKDGREEEIITRFPQYAP
jgi:rhodanese-related sulfurtransferase